MIIRPRKSENYDWLETHDGAFHVKVHRVKPSTYRWGRACKAYVACCASRPLHRLPMLAHKARIPYETLRREKARYDAFEGPVPSSYLKAIGANFEVLQRCNAMDRTEYCNADLFGYFPDRYEQVTPSGRTVVRFPAYVSTIYYALALLMGQADRAAGPGQFVMTWPEVKAVTINWGCPSQIELNARRPVFWCDGKIVPSLGKGEFNPSMDSFIELKPTSPLECDPIDRDLVRFLDPLRAFAEDCTPTPEQLALYRAIVLILDCYDPSLVVDSLRGCFGNWYGELGFLEYTGEALRICCRMAGAQGVADIIQVLKENPEPGFWGGQGRYDRVLTLIAQQIFNSRRLYRGELPEPFDPIEIPRLEYLPPPIRFSVE